MPIFYSDSGSFKDLAVSGSTLLSGSVFLPSVNSSNRPNILSIDTASGQLFFASTSSFTAATASHVENGKATYMTLWESNTRLTSSRHIIENATGLGIGKTTPNTLLDINGNTTITGSLLSSGSSQTLIGTTVIRGGTTVTGSLTSSGSNQTLIGITQVVGNTTITGSTTLSGSNQTLIGITQIVGNTTITGSTTLSGSSQTLIGITQIVGNATITGSLTASGSNQTLIGTTQIIGATTITGSLVASGSNHTIRGNTTITGSTSLSGSVNIVNIAQTNQANFLAYSVDGTVTYASTSSFTAATASNVEGGALGYVALWTGSTRLSSSILYQLGSNIGINTTNPTFALDVIGSAEITNGLNVTGSTILSGSNQTLIGTTAIRGGTTITGSLTASGSNQTLIGTTRITGNTTITGSTTISSSLTTIGNTTITGSLIASGSNQTLIGTTQVTGNTTITGSLTSSGSNQILIGITQIVGATTITGSTTISSSLTTIGNTTVTGSLTASGSSHLIRGNTTITGSTILSGSNQTLIGTTQVTGNTTITGSLISSGSNQNLIGVTQITGNTTVTGSFTSSGSNQTLIGITQVVGNTTITGSLISSGSNQTLIGTTQIIGATTVTGSVTLSGSSHLIRGNTTITGSTALSGSLELDGIANTSQAWFLAYESASGNITYASTSSFTAATASNVENGRADYITLWQTNTRLTSSRHIAENATGVGIGKTVPSTLLDINGNTTISGSFISSGSSQTLIGTTIIRGGTTITGSLTSSGSNQTLIGTTQVVGTTTVTGSLTTSGSNQTLIGTTQIIGTTTVTGSTTLSGSNQILIGVTQVIGNTTITGSLTASGSSHLIRGNTTITGSTSLSGSVNIVNIAQTSQANFLAYNTDGTVTYASTSSFTAATASQVENGRANYMTLWESNTRLTSSATLYQSSSYLIITPSTAPLTSINNHRDSHLTIYGTSSTAATGYVYITSTSLAPILATTGSFVLNGITISLTGSSPLPNTSNTIYVLTGATDAATVLNITSSINFSSSVSPYNTGFPSWLGVTSSLSASAPIGLYIYANPINRNPLDYFITSGSTTTKFTVDPELRGSVLKLIAPSREINPGRGKIIFAEDDASTRYNAYASIESDGNSVGADNARLIFRTSHNSTDYGDRMIINTRGHVGIGRPTGNSIDAQLHVSKSSADTGVTLALKVQGSTQITGSTVLSGSFEIDGIAQTNQANFLTYDSTTGNVTYASTSSFTASIAATANASIFPVNATSTAVNTETSIWSTGPLSNTASLSGAKRAIAFGHQAGNGGTGNISIGWQAGGGSGAGDTNIQNIFLGEQAGSGSQTSYSTFIGYNAGLRNGGNYSNFIGFNIASGSSLGNNNIIIGTNITLPASTANGLNIGGLIFGSGSYSTTTGNPSSGSAGGRIGIGISTPLATLHVSGTDIVTGTSTITGSLTASGSAQTLIGATTINGNTTITGSFTLSGSSHTISGSLVLSGSSAVSGTFTIIGTSSSFVAPAPPNVQVSSSNAVQNISNVWRGAAAYITPRKSGRIMVVCTGVATNSTGGGARSIFYLYQSSSATAPTANSTTPSPTTPAIGLPIQVDVNVANYLTPFAISGVFTGTIGTQYWIDLRQDAPGGGATTSSNVTITAFEL